MSIEPENVNTSEEHVHISDTYVHANSGNWSWFSEEDISDLPIDWKKLTDDECTALSQLIIIIELMVYEKNKPIK